MAEKGKSGSPRNPSDKAKGPQSPAGGNAAEKAARLTRPNQRRNPQPARRLRVRRQNRRMRSRRVIRVMM